MVSATGLFVLALFALQNASAALLMRYTRLHHRMYNNSVAVLLQEAVIKLPCCVVLYCIECGGWTPMLRALVHDFREQPDSWLKMLVPAALYTLQNNLIYFGYSNLDPAIGMITYQTKLIFTAICSVHLLGKRMHPHQWAAVCVLCAGIIAVHAFPPVSSAVPTKRVKHLGGHHVHEHASSEQPPENVQQPLQGTAAFLVAALCTASASVYFELMIKGRKEERESVPESPPPLLVASLWLRSIQLSLFASVVAFTAVLLQEDDLATKRAAGLLHGFTTLPWLCVVWNAGGGLLVAMTMKHADNILRGFAQGFAILLGAIGSYLFFGLQLTPFFSLGALLVLLSIPMYDGLLSSCCPRLAACCGVLLHGSCGPCTSDVCEPATRALVAKG